MEKEDNLKKEFKEFEVEEPSEDFTDKDPIKTLEQKKKTNFWIIVGLIALIIGISFVWMSSTANGTEPTPDLGIVPGQAYVDLDLLKCDRFLLENNFNYENSSNIESDIVDHILCVTRDVYKLYPTETEEVFGKYNIGPI